LPPDAGGGFYGFGVTGVRGVESSMTGGCRGMGEVAAGRGRWWRSAAAVGARWR
jgi:hypothetical protein